MLHNSFLQAIHTLCASVTKQYNLVLAKGRWCSAAGEVTAGLAESNGSLPPGGWLMVTCRLTACTPGSAPGPSLGIKYGKAFTFYLYLLWVVYRCVVYWFLPVCCLPAISLPLCMHTEYHSKLLATAWVWFDVVIMIAGSCGKSSEWFLFRVSVWLFTGEGVIFIMAAVDLLVTFNCVVKFTG